MLEAIDRIAGYTDGLSYEEFEQDGRVIDAVEYRMFIIGEAANHVPDEVRARVPDVPWRAVRGMRNRLAHDYFGIRLETVWKTVQQRLPELRAQLMGLLDGEE